MTRRRKGASDSCFYYKWLDKALCDLQAARLLLTYGGDLWGVFGATLFSTVYGGLFYRRATAKGVWAGILAGLAGLAAFYPAYWRGILPFHAAFPATILSCAAFLAVSRLTSPKEGRDAAAR